MTESHFACISIRQPWASLVASGIKPIENREWRCAIRGPMLIHAGKTWGRDEQAAYDELLTLAIGMGDTRRQDVIYASRRLLGGFVGIGRMVDCIHENDWYANGGRRYDGVNEWFVGPFGWRYGDARHFPRLVPFKGMQGIFRVRESVIPFPLPY